MNATKTGNIGRQSVSQQRSGIALGSLFGITVVLDWSLLIIALLVATTVAMGPLAQWHDDWSMGLRWLIGVSAAVLLFASILVHEFSHALMARRYGTPIERITLFIFGGMAHMEEDARHWRAELMIAIVGPVTSIVLGLFCLLVGGFFVSPDQLNGDTPEQVIGSLSPLASLLLWGGNVNLVLAIFNLVPAYPLDGGRVLRAILWGSTGDMRKATRWAANSGRVFGSLLMAAGIAMILGIYVPFFGTGFVGGLWLVFIGWFLSRAALASYQNIEISHSLNKVNVGDIMRTTFDALTPEQTLEQVVEYHLLPSGTRAYPVLQSGNLVGIITFDDIRRIRRDQWSTNKVRDSMVPRDGLIVINADDGSFHALSQLSSNNINQMPVVDSQQQLVGMIYREDILRWLQLAGVDRLIG